MEAREASADRQAAAKILGGQKNGRSLRGRWVAENKVGYYGVKGNHC